MREVAPGDLILAFSDTLIRKLGIARSFAYECPKPAEFGNAGPNWAKIGWRVDVHWVDLRHQIRPAEHMLRLSSLLPSRYSPLRPNGHGLQSIYLTQVPRALMEAIVDLIGSEARNVVRMNQVAESIDVDTPGQGLDAWEDHLKSEIEEDQTISDTVRQQLVLARRGQGMFRRNVRKRELRCRLTGVDRISHLRASHIKPWRDATYHEERLDGDNGLLLTPSVDHLFDRGFISFENGGRLLVSPVAHRDSLARMGVPIKGVTNVGDFSEGQRRYLEYHRNEVFLEARVKRD